GGVAPGHDPQWPGRVAYSWRSEQETHAQVEAPLVAADAIRGIQLQRPDRTGPAQACTDARVQHRVTRLVRSRTGVDEHGMLEAARIPEQRHRPLPFDAAHGHVARAVDVAVVEAVADAV